MSDELVFTVTGAEARAAARISLADAGLTERAHLQEWVLAHPAIIGEGVLVVTCEFDTWRSSAGAERDRLDVLGLDRDGRLVIAELKRDRAPDTVEMQAIKYAAMASRFTPEVLASQHASFLRHRDCSISDEEAMTRLADHVGDEPDPDLLRQPRIALIASAFPPAVTASVVWLSEMGLDITLVRVQAYNTGPEIVVTASQMYPVPDVEEFTVAPVRASARRARGDDLPSLPWDEERLRQFNEVVTNPTILATMDLLAATPGVWVWIRDVEAAAGRSQYEMRGDLAGLTMTVKRRFGRSNWPFDFQWAAGGEQNAYYSMEEETARIWRAIRGLDAAE